MSTFAELSLDTLAQQPRINQLYTQLTLCFSLSNHPSSAIHDELVRSLTEGLKLLSVKLPWTSGNVVESHGVFKIIQRNSKVKLHVRTLDKASWPHDWQALQHANFPFHMLHEDIVAPRGTLAGEERLAAGLPVFLVQANFIEDGLLLTLQGQHGAMDMAGLTQVAHLFAKACRRGDFTQEEVEIGNMEREAIVPRLSDEEYDEFMSSAKEVTKASKSTMSQEASSSKSGLTWAYFSFTATFLQELKSLAMHNIPQHSFVSTDDVLSAFIWRAITLARLPGLGNSDDLTTTMSRNVDVRAALGVPVTYPGLLVTSTNQSCGVHELLDQPLGTTASRLRALLDPAALALETRHAAEAIRRGQPSRSHGASNPRLDVRLSSWAKERCYDLDFGFGRPSAVRRPCFMKGAREGLVYFLPKAPDGEILVGFCLEKDDMERLCNLECIKERSEYIG